VNLVLNALGVLIFSGLIASDTQRLKDVYYESTDPEVLGAVSNYGALSLYLNFVNLFELLLSLASGRSRR
jgi:FtsH-binding integral membrane protein